MRKALIVFVAVASVLLIAAFMYFIRPQPCDGIYEQTAPQLKVKLGLHRHGRRRQHRLEAAGGFDSNRAGHQVREAGDQCVETMRIPARAEHLAPRGFAMRLLCRIMAGPVTCRTEDGVRCRRSASRYGPLSRH